MTARHHQLTDASQGASIQNMDDAGLVSLIAECRDRKAYDVLVGRYLTKIWKLAFSVLKTEQDADDAVQDIFLKLWTKGIAWQKPGDQTECLDEKEKIRASFATWIYKVALNRCIDLRRQKFRRSETSESQAPEQSVQETAYKTVLQQQLSSSLSDVMQDLPDGQRQALFCYYYREMTVPDIAVELQTSDQAVRALLKRGKASLRTVMQSDPDLKHHMTSMAEVLH
jgi:RNA polymerase sigma-70 factor (ECF subfamily)